MTDATVSAADRRTLAHVPPQGTWASTAEVHESIEPGQQGGVRKRRRRWTFASLIRLEQAGLVERRQVGDRHAQWTRP